ncbi:MAG: FAD-dependent oxidoreductase, partial [Bacteroidia bacterium]|nr:FAD-dependent oxidoreductase [Bacteroidia bacterium]
DENGKARAVVIAETGEEIGCDFVGLTAGVSPNIDFIKNSEIETNRGVVVNRYLETNINGIYAIGDCAEQREAIGERRTVETVWYTGRMMGETVAQTICGNRLKYNPGHWFNSAKFFDIEYQTYGWVFARPRENEAHFHWKHEDDTKCITVCYDKNSMKFLGINTFGIRMRHEVLDRWLTEGRDADFVMSNLSAANFDPEFYSRFEGDILKAYNHEFQNA